MDMDEAARKLEDLLRRAREGNPEAAQELYDRYGDHVLRVVRKILHRRLRRHYDSTDFTQAVWASFFQVPAEQASFDSPAALVTFLSRMAAHKVMETTRKRLGADKHGSARATSLDAPHPEQGGAVGERLPADIATPSQFVIADERWQLMIQGLPPGHRRILELLREGHSHVDIAEKLGLHRRVIQRLLHHLERHMGGA
jgi:RNA polymerase sigma-70 factor (ECF subfamily)